MSTFDIDSLLRKTGALLQGHFKLRSGLHSDHFFQAALVFQYPEIAAEICTVLANKAESLMAETVVSPALGGIIVGYELARVLGLKAIFAEKESDQLVLRRGFELKKGEKVLIAEDVTTRGGRVQQTIDLARGHGAKVVGVAVIVDRSGGEVTFDVPVFSLTKLDLPTYEPESCPLCAAGVPLVSPGSK